MSENYAKVIGQALRVSCARRWPAMSVQELQTVREYQMT